MKLATQIKKPPHPQPDDAIAHHVDGQPTFFSHVVKVAGITRKELQYDLRLSKTYVDLIMAGEKHDPFSRARDVCAILTARGRTDLLLAVLVHIAGGDDFDGRILSAAQVEAIRELAKAVDK